MQNFRRTVLMIGLVLLLTAGGVAVARVAGPFGDVPDDHPFAGDIAWMKESGVTRGCNPPDNSEYCPDRTVTRAEMAAFFHRYHDTMSGALTDAQFATLTERVLDRVGEKGLGADEVHAIVDAALSDLDPGPDAAAVQTLIDAAIAGLGDEILDDVADLVDGAIGEIETSLAALEDRLADLESSHGALQGSMGVIEASLDDVESSVGVIESSLGDVVIGEITLREMQGTASFFGIPVSVNCLDGEIPVGGGYEGSGEFFTLESGPTETGWRVQAVAAAETPIIVRVLCAKVGA